MKYIRNKIAGENRGQAAAEAEIYAQSEIVRLVAKATGGDFRAFGELYNIYLARIYRYVFYQVHDKMMAEDITEEVFIKAWEAIGSCRGKEQTFSSWLYRIAHNHLIDNLRRIQKQRQIEVEAAPEVGDSEQEVEKKLKWQEFLEAVSLLPQNQKRVIILKFIEGLDNPEIGEIIGKRQGAVRTLQMRALATLRKKLVS